MTTFLFWNLNKKPLQHIIANLAFLHQVDVLIFAECTIAPDVLLTALNPHGIADYHYAPIIGCKKITIYTRFSSEFIRLVQEEDRITVRHIALPGLVDMLLAAIHFPSKTYWRDSDQMMEATKLVDVITRSEQQIGHSRTILVGDMNMNPFEDGIVGAAAFHAVMSRSIAQGRDRIVQGRRYPFFYNPMWGLLGDTSSGPAGTYYRGSSEHVVLFWHMLDQVFVRPDLLEQFRNDELQILHTDGVTSFLSADGSLNSRVASDHLPLLFKVNL